jgi:cystathionine beta-lyase/cystathionine gamma-synthase
MACGKEVFTSLKACSSCGKFRFSKHFSRAAAHNTEEQRRQLGIPEGLIRYSVGIENVDDLLNDLQQALKGV